MSLQFCSRFLVLLAAIQADSRATDTQVDARNFINLFGASPVWLQSDIRPHGASQCRNFAAYLPEINRNRRANERISGPYDTP